MVDVSYVSLTECLGIVLQSKILYLVIYMINKEQNELKTTLLKHKRRVVNWQVKLTLNLY